MLGAGIHPGMNYRLRVITEQSNQRGKVPCLQCYRYLTDIWIVYPCSLIHSEQLSYSEHFQPESFTGTGNYRVGILEGECLRFCRLEGVGGHAGSVSVFVVFFWSTFMYKTFLSDI